MATVRRRLVWYGILGIAMLGAIAAIATQEKQPPDAKQTQEFHDLQIAVALARDIQRGLKNPKSFELVASAVFPDGSVCMTYRGTNGFSAVVTEQAVRPRRGAQFWATDSGPAFAKEWKRSCSSGGRDVTRMVNRML